jgi:archaemetzincin
MQNDRALSPRTTCRNAFRILAVATTIAATAISAEEPAGTPPPEQNVSALLEATYAAIGAADEAGFVRLGPPQPGEWRAHYHESPQTLERYKWTVRVRPQPGRRTIVLQPIGDMNTEAQALLETLKTYAEVFFQLPARVETPLAWDMTQPKLTRPVPASRRVGNYEKQFNAEIAMEACLKARVPADAAVYLGITMEDLFTSDTNFVFGVGSFKDRVGIYSLVRYFPEFWGKNRTPESDTLALRRALKVLNHEAGHMFGISHCVFYQCSMNGSNSLEETDRAPMHFCALCHRKLQWNLAFDATQRYTQLLAFYNEHGLKEEAAWLNERLERWKKIAAMEAAKSVREE